jgi:hypothetical protein
MKHIISFVFFIQVLCFCASAQDDPKSIERNLWRSRADILTSNLLKDASDADPLDRALLIAQLSALWWEAQRTQANTWIHKSVDLLSFYPAEEAKEQRQKFFSIARQVLALISTHKISNSQLAWSRFSANQKRTALIRRKSSRLDHQGRFGFEGVARHLH